MVLVDWSGLDLSDGGFAQGSAAAVEEAEGHRGFAFLPPFFKPFLPTLCKPLLSSAGVALGWCPSEPAVGGDHRHRPVLNQGMLLQKAAGLCRQAVVEARIRVHPQHS